MQRISGAGHVNNRFVTENVGTNRPPTEITDAWLNSIQEEIANVIIGAGYALNPLAENQLATAISALIAASVTVIGAASETEAGKVELATAAETLAGVDTTRATHAAGVKAAIQSAITALSTTINNALVLKAPLASPPLTGTPTAPTAVAGTNNTQIATTAFVAALVATITNWPGLYSGTSAANTTYPIGTSLNCEGSTSSRPFNETVVTPGYNGSTSRLYEGAGTGLLTGTWRFRGFASGSSYNIQRVA